MNSPKPDSMLRAISEEARVLLSQLPPTASADTPRYIDDLALRSSAGSEGEARAELLAMLAEDVTIMLGSLTLFVEGIADCLQVAEARDGQVNLPTLSTIVRPAIEIAGQILWLIGSTGEPEMKARRYSIWRLVDLRSRRSLLRDFAAGVDTDEGARAELDVQEREILDLVSAAKWDFRTTSYKNNGVIEAAALLDPVSKKAESIPKIVELVKLVSTSRSLYGLLSVSAHGLRLGAFYSLESDGGPPDKNGRFNARMSGFGLPPNLVIGFAGLATIKPARAIAEWNGVDISHLQELGRNVLKLTGM